MFDVVKSIVKVFISRLLLAIYMLSATPCNQLLKLPVLVVHFQEHQHRDASTSFLSFIYHHYAINHADDGDTARDQQLPFQSHDDCGSFQVPIYLFPRFEPLAPRVVILQSEKPSFYSDSDLLATYLAAIWQPPQRA